MFQVNDQQAMNSSKKMFFFLSLGFILTSILGSVLIEGTRIVTAKSLGYDYRYIRSFGTFLFHSDKIDEEFLKLEIGRTLDENYKESSAYKALIRQNQKNEAIINASGYGVSCLLLLIGFFLLYRRSDRKQAMKVSNWLGFFLSLVFVRYLVYHSVTIYSHSLFCQETSFFHVIGLPTFISIYILYAIGVTMALYIVYLLPKEHRLKTILSGLVGGLIGLIIWMKLVGPSFI